MKPHEAQLSDFVGEHGPYQLTITIILFIRYVLLGLMANSGPLMTPDVTFYCDLPMEEVVAIMPNITTLNRTEQELEIKEEFKRICQIDLHLYQQAYFNQTSINGNNNQAANNKQQQPLKAPNSSNSMGQGNQMSTKLQLLSLKRPKFNMTARIRECNEFTYELAPDQGRTMTDEFDLVCDRDWFRSLFQSLISAAVVVAHVFWGTFSDKYGRYKAEKICLFVSLLAGTLSCVAMDFWTFTIARALCSFGDLGIVVSLTTTVVELVGNQYRGISVALVNFGYALGVTLFPYIVAYFENFRVVVGFTVLCHLATIPLVLTTSESVRWLLTNRKFKLAHRELKRIARFNQSARLCCTIWPNPVGLLCCWRNKPTTSAAKYPPPAASSPSEQQSRRRAFDLLFRKFIEQIESQNLCDPEQQQPPEDNNMALRDECKSIAEQARHQQQQQCKCNNEGGGSHGCASCCSTAAATPTKVDDEQSSSPEKIEATVELASVKPLLEGAAKEAAAGAKEAAGGSCSASIASIDNVTAAAAAAEQQQQQQQQVPLVVLTAAPQQQQQLKLVDDAYEGKTTTRGGEESWGEAILFRPRASNQPDCINLVAHQLSFMGRVSRLFKDKTLMIAVFTIVWTTFNSELQYTSFIIINMEVGEDVYLNYMLGGCMEALAAITASLLLSYASRRHSLICFWLLISASCFGLSVAHIDSTWAVWLLALAKFSQSCLSSIASVAAYESFPTFLRQSGSGLVFTLGMLGSVFAPLIFAEFDDHAGMDRVLMTFSFSSLTAATLIYLFLKETRNCELQ